MKALYFKLLFLFITISSTGYGQTVKKSPEYKDKVQLDQLDKVSIYSFLVKNNLTSKSEQEFYSTYADTTKAKELYGFFVENKLTDKDFGDFYTDNISKEKWSNILANRAPVRSFKASGKVFDIPIDKVKLFLLDMPEAKEVKSFLVGKDTLDIPIEEVPAFMKVSPYAKPFPNNQYVRHERKNNESKEHNGNNSNFKLYNHLIDSKRITPEELGDFETFNKMLSNHANAIKLHKKLIRIGFTEDEIGKQSDFLANIDQSSTPTQLNTHFQIDKIKVGDTFIDLPIPSGFVKVDDTMGGLLETAKKMCPETNILLAYYISAEDYANFLTKQSSSFDKYIFVEVFDGLKEKQVGSKDYRQFLNSFKKEYIDKFQKDLEKGGMQAAENLSKIDENLKMENIKMLPFGICYESENSISYGVLSKYTFAIDDESSTNYIVAAISSITKVDQKPIFLYSYKTYKSAEDINTLKALNASWVKEIDKRQSSVSFFSDFDFKDYKEAILAILTLSFIWAIYFATKKIQRKLKTKNVKEKPETEDNIEYLDLDELFTEEEISIEPIPILVETEKIQDKVQISNPELFKVSRQLRFFNLLIDIVFLYFLAYVAGFVLLFLFGQTAASKLIQNQYLFGSSLTFITYFIQELMFSKTLGKLITKTHVINNLGQRPTVWQLILRSVSRVIPFEAFTYLSKEKRGLHDIISKTYVVKD